MFNIYLNRLQLDPYADEPGVRYKGPELNIRPDRSGMETDKLRG